MSDWINYIVSGVILVMVTITFYKCWIHARRLRKSRENFLGYINNLKEHMSLDTGIKTRYTVSTEQKPKQEKLMKYVFGAVLAVCLMLAVVFGAGYVSVYNTEVSLRNTAAAQWNVTQGFHDKMWKILKEKAQITEQYRATFNEIYPKLIKGRYEQNSKLLAQFITEANPNFDTSLLHNLMVSVEAERTGFFNEQKKLQNIQQEYNSLLESFFARFVVGGKAKMDYKMITSDATEEVFKSGKDNNVGVFGNK